MATWRSPCRLTRRWVPRRGGESPRPWPLPGTQPNLTSLVWSQTPPSLANSGRTLGGCGRPGHLRRLRLSVLGGEPRVWLGASAWGQGGSA